MSNKNDFRLGTIASSSEQLQEDVPHGSVVTSTTSRSANRYSEATPAIDDIDRSDILGVLRQVFNDRQARNRENAIREVARALGYGRSSSRIQKARYKDLMTAVRRGILENTHGELRLPARSIEQYDRDFLKDHFRTAIGRSWVERGDAIRAFSRWLGFTRTGSVIDEIARSLINGLLREGRLESDGSHFIRRTL